MGTNEKKEHEDRPTQESDFLLKLAYKKVVREIMWMYG